MRKYVLISGIFYPGLYLYIGTWSGIKNIRIRVFYPGLLYSGQTKITTPSSRLEETWKRYNLASSGDEYTLRTS